MDDDKLLYKVPHVAELLETSRSKTYELVGRADPLDPTRRLDPSARAGAAGLDCQEERPEVTGTQHTFSS